jgi:hypothetical protein
VIDVDAVQQKPYRFPLFLKLSTVSTGQTLYSSIYKNRLHYG